MSKRAVPSFLFKAIQEAKSANLVLAGDCVIAAVSAGADSIFLLELLDELRREIDFELAVAHFNHHLRPEFDAEEEAYVQSIAATKGLKYFSGEASAEKIRNSKDGLEAGARRARQAFFKSLLLEIWRDGDRDPDSIKIALGHHADDLAESMLLQLTRGTGIQGLIGMRSSEAHYIRPLLELRAKDLREYLDVQGIKYFDDHTNSDCRYLRNAIRHQLIPYWNELSGHDLVPKLCQTSNNLEAYALAADYYIEEQIRRLIGPAGQLNSKLLLQYPRSLQTLLLHRFIRGNDYRLAPSARQVSQILDSLEGERQDQCFELGNKRRLLHLGGILILESESEY
ncbi:MAG: tRNA lysidine(34) synthetase TilS [Eubacteriales bacterium]|nr:tRNA lysidine(34) synthetase TilS [Eubacteriales bacterium]